MLASNLFLNVLNNTPISYRLHTSDDSQSSGVSLAEKLISEPDRITKTILFRSKERRRYIAVITSANKTVDVQYISRTTSCDEVLPSEELSGVPGCGNGICPFDLPRFFQIMIDESLIKFSTILIESGSMGVIEVKPFDFLFLVQGQLARLTEW